MRRETYVNAKKKRMSDSLLRVAQDSWGIIWSDAWPKPAQR